MNSSPSWTFQRPYRTLGMRLFNLVGRQLRRWGWRRRLTLDSVLASAIRRTKLSDWGDDRFRQPLQILVDSFEEDANLTPLGRLLARLVCVHHAANRLRACQAIKTHPQILQQPVARPIFVVGFPRTGTTLLHNLLSQHGSARPLLFWEAIEPTPDPRVWAGGKDRRPARARRLVSHLNRRGVPGLPAVHLLQAEGPEECTWLLLNTFVSPAFFLFGFVRGYLQWLQGQGRTMLPWAYEQHRQFLQILQHGRAPGHWVLKSPAHLFGLEELLQVYPDACVVLTHRDMEQVIPSACSLFALSQGLFSDQVNCQGIGKEIANLFRPPSEDLARKIRADNPGRIFDIHYRSLIADPIGTVRSIHRYFDLDMDGGMESRMQQWLAANTANKHGVHQYHLEQFGLTPADVQQVFGDYNKLLAVPSES